MTNKTIPEKSILKTINHIITDIDGTLLNDSGELGETSKKLLMQLMQLDVTISFATGRLHSAVTKLAEEVKLNGFIISLDGALIKSFIDDKTIYESFIGKSKVKKAISLADENLVNIVLCHSAAIYYTEDNSSIPALLNKYGASYTKVESYNDYVSGTLEIVCSSDMKSSIKKIEERFSFPYSLGCNTSYFRSKKNENIFYLEIRKAGSSKGKAVNRIMNYLSSNTAQTAVIGDWYNDITMFELKVYKVAVANAIPELRNKADFVTSRSNKEEGIAEFLELVLKSKRN